MVISQEKNECWSCHVTFGLTTKAWRYVTLVEVEVREGERERKHPSLLLRRLSCEGAEQRELFYQRRRRRRGRRPRDQEDDCTLRLFLHPTSQSFFFFDGPGIEQSQPQEAKESSSAMLAAAGSLLKCLLFKRSNLHAFFNLFLFSISKSLQSSIIFNFA